MLKKFTAFQVESAVLVPKNAGPARLSRIRRAAHRHHFDYEPRRGFLYVRSRAISSRTNDNYDEFPAEEIKQAYRTFIGKPVFVNHVNDNHHRARGVIIDAALHEDTLSDGSPDTWAEVLMEVDAIRFPKLAEAILAGRIDRTSMGCDVAYSICSMCGNKATTPAEYCQHIPRLKGKKVLKRNAATGSQEEHLIRETCYGLKFFENSLLVEEPADPTAFFTGVDSTGLGKAASKTVAHWTDGRDDLSEEERARYRAADERQEQARAKAEEFRAQGLCDCPGSLKIEPHPSGEHSEWAQRMHAAGKTDAWGHPLHQPYDGHGAWNCNNFNCVEHPQAMYEQGLGMPGWMQHDLATSPEEKAVRREVGKAFHDQGLTEDARYLLDQQDQGPTKYSSMSKMGQWYYNRSQVNGEPIVHPAGQPLKDGRPGLDVGDHVLFEDGHSARIKAITRNLLLLEGHPTPMHRGPIEGDHSKSIWSSDTIDEAGQDVPGMTEEQRRFLDSNSGGPTKYSSLDPSEIARAVDKASDDLGRQHMDDLTFVPHWEPLRKAMPENELGGWMFMGRHQHPDDHVANEAWDPDLGTPLSKDFGRTDKPRREAPGELVDYKHGITRARLTLDKNGHAWKVVHQPGFNGLDQGRALSGPYSPGSLLKQHYQDLESFGHTPETPYDDDFIAERNQRLKDAGYSVVEGRTPHQGSLVQHFAASYPGSPEYREGDRVWNPVSGHEGQVTGVHPSHVPYTSHEVSVRWDHGGHERLPEQHIDHSPNAPAEQQERAGHSYRDLESANQALQGLGDDGWLFAQQPTGPTRQSSRKTASTACPDCGGEEYYPGEHADHPALHGKTRTSQDSVHLWQDQHGLTNVPMKWRSPSEHPLWDHFHTEELAWHPENPSNATEDWETDPGPEDHLVDDFTPLRQSLNLSQHFAEHDDDDWDEDEPHDDDSFISYMPHGVEAQALGKSLTRYSPETGRQTGDLGSTDDALHRILHAHHDAGEDAPIWMWGEHGPSFRALGDEVTNHITKHLPNYMGNGPAHQGKTLPEHPPIDEYTDAEVIRNHLVTHHDQDPRKLTMWRSFAPGEKGHSGKPDISDLIDQGVGQGIPHAEIKPTRSESREVPMDRESLLEHHRDLHEEKCPHGDEGCSYPNTHTHAERDTSALLDSSVFGDEGKRDWAGFMLDDNKHGPTKFSLLQHFAVSWETWERRGWDEPDLERDRRHRSGNQGEPYPKSHLDCQHDHQTNDGLREGYMRCTDCGAIGPDLDDDDEDAQRLLDEAFPDEDHNRDGVWLLDQNQTCPRCGGGISNPLEHVTNPERCGKPWNREAARRVAGTSPDDNPMNHIFRGNPGQEDCHCGWGEDMHPHLTAGPGVRCATCGGDYKHHPLHDTGRYHWLREQAARPPVDPKAQMESLFSEFGRDYHDEGARDLIDGAFRNPRSAEEWLNKGTQGPTKYSLLQHFSSHPDYPSGVPFECPDCGDYRTQDHCDTCYDQMLYGKKPSLLRRWMRGASLTQHFASAEDYACGTDHWPRHVDEHGHVSVGGPDALGDSDCGHPDCPYQECDDPRCKGFPEGWHTRAEHMDPDPEQMDRTDHFHHVHGQDVRCSDLDHCPSICDHTSENCDVHATETGRLIDSAFGDQAEDGKWLLDQQPTGPTKYSLLQALADNSYRMRDHGDPSEMQPRLRDQQSYREHLMQDHGYSKADLDRLQDRQWRKARDGEVEVPSGRDNLRGVVEFLEAPMKAEHNHLHAGDPTRFVSGGHTHPMLDHLVEPDLHDEKRRADPARGGFVDPQNPNVSPYKRLDGTHSALPNLQKGHDPHDPSTWTNLSACQQTYPISDDERGDYMAAAHRAQDAWRDGKISRETFEGLGHMCHECGAFKYLHAQPYSFDPDRLRQTIPVTPLRQSLNSGFGQGDADAWKTCDQGHRHWGTEGAAGLLIRHRSDDGSVRYLLQHRAPWVDDGDTWGIPAGALHHGEDPLEGAKREAVEELGNIPHGLRHVDTHTDDHGGWAFHTLIMESPSMWGSSGGEDADHEVGEGGTGWYTPEQMKDMKLHPGFAKNWDRLQEMAKTSKRVGQRNVWPVRVKVKDRATGRYTGTYVGNQNSERGSWPFRVCEDHLKQLQGDIARHNLEASDHPHLYEAEHDTWPMDPTSTEDIANCDACMIGSVNKAFATRRTANHPDFFDPGHYGPKDLQSRPHPDRMSDDELHHHLSVEHGYGDDGVAYNLEMTEPGRRGMDSLHNWSHQVSNYGLDPNHSGKPMEADDVPHVHGDGWRPGNSNSFGVDWQSGELRHMDTGNTGHVVETRHCPDCGEPLAPDAVGHIHLSPEVQDELRAASEAGQMVREMHQHNQRRVVNLSDPADLRAHMMEAHDFRDDDFWRNSHDEDHPALNPTWHSGGDDRPLFKSEIRRLHDWEHGHGIVNEDPDYHGGSPGHFLGDEHFHTASRTAAAGDATSKGLVRHDVPAEEVQEGDYLDINGRVRVHRTMQRGGEVTLAWRQRGSKAPGVRSHQVGETVKVWRKQASLRKKADEDQCPRCSEDSNPQVGKDTYRCQSCGFVHDGAGLAKKATWIGDHFDEPTLFWRAPKSKQWEVHVHNFTPGRDLREGYGAKPTQDVYLLHADNKSDRMAPGYKGPNPGAWQVRRHPYPSQSNDGIQYTHNAWGGAPGHVPPHVVKQVKKALDTVEQHAEDHANLYGGLAEQQDIRDDLSRVPRDMAAEEKAHRMFDRLMEQSRDDDDPHTASRRTAAWNVPGLTEFSDTNDRWSKPKGRAPYDPLKAHHGLEPKQEGHGPWYVTRHPETEAYQVVDAKNRLVQSFKTPGHPAYELHDSNAENQAIHRAVQANQDHGHMPKWVDRDGNEVEATGVPRWGGNGERIPGAEKARRPGESEEDAFGIDAQHIGFHLPAPPWEHGTEHPRMAKYRQMAEENPPEKVYPPKTVMASSSREHGTTYRQVQHGEPDYDSPGAFHDPSPDEEWHGPYRVIQHPDTGRYHVVDNQNRVTRYGGREGMDDVAQAHYMRDYADGRQASKEKAKGLAEGLWNSTMEILDPGGTDDSRRAERNMRSMDELMHRYEGGDQHPLHPGRFGYDEDEDGDNGEPYYEVTDPGGSGWKARDYGGNTVRIHHAATGDTEHDLYTIGDERENQKPVGFGHDELHQALSHFVNGDPSDSEPYAPGPDYAENDPRVKRWQRRNGYTHG